MMQQQDWSFLLAPGLGFTPTDEEILDYYLQTRISGKNSVSQYYFLIKEFDVYSTEPWNLPRDFFWYRNEESDIYFFTPRHPTSKYSKRANRKAGQGFWDGKGKDTVIKTGSEIVGHKTSLNFKLIKGGDKIKTDWIMWEYRLSKLKSTPTRDTTFEDIVLCKIHRKKSTSNKDAIKRSKEEEKEDGFVEEQGMVKKSRVEEDRTLSASFRIFIDESRDIQQLPQEEVSHPNGKSHPGYLQVELSLPSWFGDNQDDHSLSDDWEFFSE